MIWDRRKCVLLMGLIGLLIVSLAGCGGGGGGGAAYLPPADSGVRLSGTVAAGAPIAGIVNVKGANGAVAQTTIGLDGKFGFTEAQLADLTKPYILFAQGTVNGRSASLYSATDADGTINITPITDFILRNALGGSAETAYTNWDTASASVSSETLDAAETKVETQLQPVMDAAGVSTDVDLMSGEFEADHTGIDKVLDIVSIQYDNAGTSATVTNNVTGTSFTDNVTTATDDSNSLPSTDTTNTQTAISDETAINNVFTSLCQMYGTARPSYSTVSTWANANVASDFLDYGYNRDQMVSSWTIDNEGPGVGCTMKATLSSLISGITPTYSKGYVVSISYSDPNDSDNFETEVVYNGTKWLWYGDRKWLDIWIVSEAHRQIDATKTAYYSGVETWINDTYSYAYNKGVRSAVVSVATGTTGTVDIVLGTLYPVTWYSLQSGCLNNAFGNHCWLNDGTISQIDDYAPYTLKLCSNDAASIALNPASCTALQTYTGALGKKPLLSSELSNALFPALTTPSSLSLSGMGWNDGYVQISWKNPSGRSVDHVDLQWYDGANMLKAEEDDFEGATSVNLDTLGTTTPPQSAGLWMSTDDDGGQVSFSASWSFN